MAKLIPLTAVKKEALICITSDRELVVRCTLSNTRYIYVLNLSNTSLIRHIPSTLALHDTELLRVFYVLYKFILRVGDSRELRKFKFLPKNVLPTLREAVFSSREMVSLKLATISCMMNGFNPTKHFNKVQVTFRSFGLTKDDALLYVLLFHNGDHVALIENLKKVEEGFSLVDGSLQEEVADKLIQRKFYCMAKKVAYRKLRFVYEGNRLSVDDMINELVMSAIQSYYWVRPFHTKLHACNYALRSIERVALNLIRHYTDPSRARVVSDGDGYTNTLCSYGEYNNSDGFTEDAMLLWLDIKRAAA